MIKITYETYVSNKIVSGYIKYELRDGTVFEKTRLVRNLNVKLVLHNRKLVKIDQ